jgi:hypothetical protein
VQHREQLAVTELPDASAILPWNSMFTVFRPRRRPGACRRWRECASAPCTCSGVAFFTQSATDWISIGMRARMRSSSSFFVTVPA